MVGFSLHSLPASTVLLTYLLSYPTLAASQSYVLDTSYSGATFFNGWNFWSSSDPTHGFVQYLSQSDAQAASLIHQSPGFPAYMGVDHTTTLNSSSQGRKSVRIESQKSWTHGLFIVDVAHMPDSTCGVWPAFWMYGPNWPNSGEIDMIEGINRNTFNQMSLHTAPNCSMQAGTQSGSVNSLQCDGTQNDGEGCNVASNNGYSYGTGFNAKGGGVYATEWTSSYIKTWFFANGSVPSDITTGSPVPSGWGTPQTAYIGGSTCDIDSHFMNQNLVFDMTFCGDWAGNAWSGDSTCSALADTCVDYVAASPSAFSETYWSINSVKVYQLLTSASSSTSTTTLMTLTKTSSSSSSSRLSSSTLATASSSTVRSTTSSLSTSSSKSSSASTSLLSSSSTSSLSSVKTSTLSSTTSSRSSTGLTTSTSSAKSSTSSSTKLATVTSTKTSATSSSKSATPTWSSLGCYSDNVNGRALPNGETVPGGSQSMTVELCQTACKSAGYTIAGLEYSQECWCGNSFVNGGAYVGADGTSGCVMACKGNSKEVCGGSNRLGAWKYG